MWKDLTSKNAINKISTSKKTRTVFKIKADQKYDCHYQTKRKWTKYKRFRNLCTHFLFLLQFQGVAPPPRPPPPQHYSFRVNESDLIDDVDTTGHMEVDATPPVAAKSLRKSRKRGSTLNSSTSQNTSVSWHLVIRVPLDITFFIVVVKHHTNWNQYNQIIQTFDAKFYSLALY